MSNLKNNPGQFAGFLDYLVDEEGAGLSESDERYKKLKNEATYRDAATARLIDKEIYDAWRRYVGEID